ncbi:hypothetical protein TNCV_4670921 [Trichonephila clavipes]|nr:hypothetical protein TNCV_4670921 [Trichonephila clavipes]
MRGLCDLTLSSSNTEASPIAPHKGVRKHPGCHNSVGMRIDISKGKEMEVLCSQPKRYHPKHRRLLIRMHLFHGCVMDKNEENP